MLAGDDLVAEETHQVVEYFFVEFGQFVEEVQDEGDFLLRTHDGVREDVQQFAVKGVGHDRFQHFCEEFLHYSGHGITAVVGKVFERLICAQNYQFFNDFFFLFDRA